VFRHGRVSGLVALPGNREAFDTIYQAIPANQVLFDGTSV
jgi:hypothetical protein